MVINCFGSGKLAKYVIAPELRALLLCKQVAIKSYMWRLTLKLPRLCFPPKNRMKKQVF